MNNEILKYDDILKLKAKIDQGKTRLSELKGQKDSQMEILKNDLKCESIPVAEKKVKELEVSISNTEIKIDEACDKLREEYPDLFL